MTLNLQFLDAFKHELINQTYDLRDHNADPKMIDQAIASMYEHMKQDRIDTKRPPPSYEEAQTSVLNEPALSKFLSSFTQIPLQWASASGIYKGPYDIHGADNQILIDAKLTNGNSVTSMWQSEFLKFSSSMATDQVKTILHIAAKRNSMTATILDVYVASAQNWRHTKDWDKLQDHRKTVYAFLTDLT